MKMKAKSKGSATIDHLLRFSHSPYFESFCVLTKESRKFLLEWKESLLIKR